MCFLAFACSFGTFVHCCQPSHWNFCSSLSTLTSELVATSALGYTPNDQSGYCVEWNFCFPSTPWNFCSSLSPLTSELLYVATSALVTPATTKQGAAWSGTFVRSLRRLGTFAEASAYFGHQAGLKSRLSCIRRTILCSLTFCIMSSFL